MASTKTILLSPKQIEQRVNRIAYQVYEDCADEQEIILCGIHSTGFQFARLIADVLKKIAPFSVDLIELKIDKHSQVAGTVVIPLSREALQGKVIVVVDDVLNSGKTMMHALKPFLEADIKKIRTVVLVDRNHRRYPMAADFVGLSLATTLQEHVSAEFGKDGPAVFLS